jgi:hypothetical protein
MNIPVSIMTPYMHWKEDGEILEIALASTSNEELDAIRHFLVSTGCAILIQAESFYKPLNSLSFRSPSKYKPGWHIQNGVMYVDDPATTGFVFSNVIYRLHKEREEDPEL